MPTEDTSPSYRLPRTVVPERYELTLTPDIEGASFHGEERVTVTVHEPVTEIVLNAIELDIHTAELQSADGRALEGTVTLDDVEERAVITLSGTADPGEWTLHCTFSGILNDKLRGWYRSTFTDDDGNTHTIATSQLQATDARRAFPCWDEPDFKAVFAITLVVDEGLLAVSNAGIVMETDLENGRRQITFADTMKMSTYLVAFVVGPLEATDPIDVDGVPLRVVCVPGKKHLADFALESGAHSLRFFTEYFGIPYPGDKLDLVGLPDFAAGAMENVGCVTFREAVLLVDPAAASRIELERVADVVAHEIAHMWFGDLVTMKWWNGIWLNEAFATFMELLAVDDFKPEWERWVSFGRSRAAAMVVDGLSATRTIEYPVGRPEEADGMFDVLTYQKGAAVLRMLEQFIGPDQFRAGIRRYLDTHKYGNTETGDLWDAIEAATGEPARATMDSWVFQEGYPVVAVEGDGASLQLEQQRFLFSGATDEGGQGSADPTRWQVPVLVRADGDVRARTLLGEAIGRLELEKKPEYVVVNEGGSGFYRVKYSTELLGALTEDLAGRLAPLERLNLVNDTWASVVAGLAPLSDFLAALPADEEDPNVWWAVIDPMAFLATMCEGDDAARFQTWARSVLRPAFDTRGWDVPAGSGEQAGPLRALLALALGTWAGDTEVAAQGVERHAAWVADPASLHPDLVPTATTIVAFNGDAVAYDAMVQRWKHPATPQEETRSLYALGDFREPTLVQRTLDMLLPDVRSQNAPFLLMYMLANGAARDEAWSWIERHWDEMRAKWPENMIPRLVHDYLNARMQNGITGFGPELAARAKAFLAAHPFEPGSKTVAQGLERLDVHLALRERETPALLAFLAQT
ncbi:MAG TPA: M1 family metallopeptidase [Acidimicrobiales bacterium]|nr:M1 family metallopeptidase [Acidimicrobiales bacterium]